MLTFEPTVTMIATIALPCAAIIFGMVALVTVVRRRSRLRHAPGGDLLGVRGRDVRRGHDRRSGRWTHHSRVTRRVTPVPRGRAARRSG